ncbi:MAG TPA: hypothetical protein VFR90_06095 [Methylibium sp.]|uniref:hypothetical protein n=1 Tax=Methylibium sp. TaxID=2067992 RepID=UPI002DBAD77D|nr:hypothetical protein [Methylibium sp.]HEU4458676.1 hypothetical protein [Methylibium sp.]
MTKTVRGVAFALALCVAPFAAAQTTKPARKAPPQAEPAVKGDRADQADIDRTQILGNRELPKVLYIVPWKKPLPGDLSGRPPSSVVDEALAPIDRDVFRRQVQYDAQTQAAPAR